MNRLISEGMAAGVLWVAFFLLLPLPYWFLSLGFGPPVRMAFVGSLALGFVLSGPGTVSWAMFGLFGLQTVLAAYLTRRLAGSLVAAFGGTTGVPLARLAAVMGVLVGLAALPIYYLPYSSGEVRTNWMGVFH